MKINKKLLALLGLGVLGACAHSPQEAQQSAKATSSSLSQVLGQGADYKSTSCGVVPEAKVADIGSGSKPGNAKEKFAELLKKNPTAAGSILPPGFVKTTVWQGLNLPTAVKFAANGMAFVAEKNGIIKSFDSVGDTTPTTVANLSGLTYTDTDHGLLGLAIHPQYPAQPYIYVLYSRQLGSNGARLSRLTLTNGIMTAETQLINGWCQQSTSHAVGDLNFGADGMLYVTSGDGASPGFADYGQGANSAGAFNCGDPNQQGGSMRSQDLLPGYNADPVDFNGTMLRLDPLTGAAAAANPLLGGDAKDDRIVAYGLRNPFRFTIHPTTNEAFIADVGWDAWEEIDRIQNPLNPNIKNFGWPCYEGNHINGAIQANNLPMCNSLYGAQAGLHTPPFWEYSHAASPNGIQAGITAISFYTGDNYGPQYKNALFFGDYTDGWTKVAFPDANGVPNMNNILLFDNTPQIVGLSPGPGGDLFYVEHNDGKIYRYSNSNQADIIASMDVDKAGGNPGVTVAFDGSGSSDPSGGVINYSWDLNGDGQFGDATTVNPTYNYTNAGTYVVTLRVSNAAGDRFAVANQVITVSDLYPVASITSPLQTTLWKTGDTIAYSGSGFIPATGEVVAADKLNWVVSVFHCALNDATVCHKHNGGTFNGASGTFLAPDHDYPSRLDISLAASGPAVAQNWWDANWTKRRRLFFNNLNNAEALVNFPVLLTLDATRIDYNAAGANGASLRFVSADGTTLLPYEVEAWNATGKSYVWVKVPSIPANSANSFVWMYYGNAAAASAQTPATVWNGGHVGVWHMNASSNDATGVNNGVNNGSTDVAGKIGGARQFNGTTNYIAVPDNASLKLATNYTIEAFIKINNADLNSYGRIVSKKAGFNDATGYSFEYNPLTNQVTGLAGGPAGNLNWYRAEPVDLDLTWHYLVATVNGANATIYVDGLNRTSDNVTVATTVNNLALNIGRDSLGDNYFAGGIDELRLSNVTRSAAWVAAQNRSMNGKFVNFSAEDTPSPLVGSATVTVLPETTSVTVNTQPQGLNVVLNGETGPAPITHQVIVNATTNIVANSPQNKNGLAWAFNQWNDNDTSQSRVFSNTPAAMAFTASYNSTCASTYNAMKVRGTNNAFASTPMTFNATSCQWELASTTFGATATERFKFDVNGDWVTNFGDIAPANGIADPAGADIAITQGPGPYSITFNDVTKAYTVTKLTMGNAMPTANAGPDQAVAAGATVTFNGAGSTDTDGTIASYTWTSAGQPNLAGVAPTQVFAAAGTYTYTLTVADNLGATATDTVVITVTAAANAKPVANAGPDQTVAAGATVTFNGAGSSDSDGTIASYAWTAAGQPNLAGAAPTRVFAAAGTFTYTLTVTDNLGATATDTVVITVTAVGFNKTYPQVYVRGTNNNFALTTPMVLVANNTWQLDTAFGATATERFKFDIYGNWVTNFGDNAPANGVADAGGADIAIKLGAGNYRIVFNDATKVYTVAKLGGGNAAPVANAGPDQTVAAGATVTFNGAGSTDSDGTIASYAWTAAGQPNLAGAAPTQTFAAAGTYTYTLTVTDNGGATATDAVVITVTGAANAKPVANAGPDQTVAAGATVTFNGAGSSDSDGTIASYVWTIAGQANLTGVAPTRVFAAAGTFAYTLTVTDNLGATATDTVVITVTGGAFNKLYPQVYLRGTNNNFGITTQMALVANNTWQVDAVFGATATERFKFDIYGNWVTNFGDNAPANGVADAGGADIAIKLGAGNYRIVFNDATKVYTVTKLAADGAAAADAVVAPLAVTTSKAPAKAPTPKKKKNKK